MHSERHFAIRLPETLLISIDAGVRQGLPAREASLTVGAINSLLETAQRLPCDSCRRAKATEKGMTCTSPALARIKRLSDVSAPAEAAAFAHCSMREER